MTRLFTMEAEDPRSQVLAITNMWPDSERPAYGIFIKRQLESLQEFGVHVDVAYVRGKTSTLAYPVAAAILALRTLRPARRYQLVHVHAGETALAARFLVGPPMLVSYYGDDLLGDPRADGTLKPKSVARSLVLRQHARLFRATNTQSEEMEGVLPRRVRQRNTVLAGAVDAEVFRPANQSQCRRELGWGADERVALFVGNPAVERKRFWLAEAACEWAQKELGPVRLQVATRVAPDDLPILMNAADVLLFPSSLEGSPNTVKEALMCNLPVIASRVADIPDLLRGVEPSYLCEPAVEAYAAALSHALTQRQRSNGRAKENEFSKSANARQLLDLYHKVAPGLNLGASGRSG